MELLVTVWRHTGDKPSVSFSHFKLLLAGHRNKKTAQAQMQEFTGGRTFLNRSGGPSFVHL